MVRKSPLFTALAVSLLFAPSLFAQDAATPASHLPPPANWTTTDVPVGQTVNPYVCGQNSKVYFRRIRRGDSVFKAPVIALSLDGTSKTIDLRSDIGLTGDVEIYAYNTDSSGAIYAIAKSTDHWQPHLVSYDEDGRYVSKVALQESFFARFMLAINDNRFLAAGMKRPATLTYGPDPKASITSLFDNQGKEVKALKLPEDDATITMDLGISSDDPIEFGTARLGPDGRVFVFKASAQPRVQILDADGSTQQVLTLTPPTKTSEPTDFFVVDHSRAVVVYARHLPFPDDRTTMSQFITLYDTDTGEMLANDTYDVPGNIVCSEGNSLVFMTAAPDRRHYQLGRSTIPIDVIQIQRSAQTSAAQPASD
jgi:hypothetical protein